MEATPRFVLEAGRECQRALAGAGGAGGLGGPDSRRRSASFLHSAEIICPTVGVAVDNEGSPQDIPGSDGERVQEEAVEREREEAVEQSL